MLKAMIFDMDGVLLDTTPYIWESFDMVLRDYGISLKKCDTGSRFLGRSLRDILEIINDEYDVKQRLELKDFSEKSWKIQFDLIKKNAKIDTDLVNLIADARNSGIKIAVATSSPEWRTNQILDHINLLEKIDVLVTCDDVDRHKPHPDIYSLTSEKLGFDPEKCIVFEDAVNGINAAKNAGMRVVGVLTEHQTESDLKNSDLIIKNFSEINLEKIKKLF